MKKILRLVDFAISAIVFTVFVLILLRGSGICAAVLLFIFAFSFIRALRQP
jgi:hypothetical protein